MKKYLILIAILVVFASLIGCQSKIDNKIKETPKTNTVNVTDTNKEEKTKEVKSYPIILKDTTYRGFQFSNLVYENDYICKISGTVKNLNGSKYSAIVRVIFYDKNNKEIGKATGALDKIGPNETQNFLGSTTETIENISTARIEMDLKEW